LALQLVFIKSKKAELIRNRRLSYVAIHPTNSQCQ
jgi:hypothetical protein